MPFLSDLRYVRLFLIAIPIEATASNTTLEGPVSGLDMIGYASIPAGSGAASGPFSDEFKAGIDHPAESGSTSRSANPHSAPPT
jgi:hypothetical protein